MIAMESKNAEFSLLRKAEIQLGSDILKGLIVWEIVRFDECAMMMRYESECGRRVNGL